MVENKRSLNQTFFLCVFFTVFALSFAAYFPGLYGGFLFDDHFNIVANERIKLEELTLPGVWQAALSGDSGLFKRPLSMLSFTLNYVATGLDPFFFKLTNVFIHLANGLGVFFLTFLVLKRLQSRFASSLSDSSLRWLSLTICFTWLIHPLNVTSVLYVVQRMTSLATLFVLGGLIFYVWGRQHLFCKARFGVLAVFSGVVFFSCAAVLSKENGILLPLYVLVIELVLFGFETNKSSSQDFLPYFFLTLLGLPAIVFLAYSSVHPEWLIKGYSGRDFTLPERLMTEARVLWLYLRLIIVPSNSALGLYHDDIEVSRHLLDPPTTIWACASVPILLFAAILFRRRAPLICLGILFFFAGHTLESTIIPLEIAHEHRNYLPMLGILIGVIYYLATRTHRARWAAISVWIGLLIATTAMRADYWGNPVEHMILEAAYHPNSVRANYESGRIFSELAPTDKDKANEHYEQAISYFKRSAELRRSETGGLFALITLKAKKQKAIEPELLSELKFRLQNEPFAANTENFLAELIRGYIAGRYPIAAHEVQEILKAAAQNSTLQNRAKANVFTSMANFVAYEFKDYSQAIRLSYRAINAIPSEPQYRLNIVHLFIRLRNFNRAQEELDAARRVDTLRRYAATTARLDRLIRQGLSTVPAS